MRANPHFCGLKNEFHFLKLIFEPQKLPHFWPIFTHFAWRQNGQNDRFIKYKVAQKGVFDQP